MERTAYLPKDTNLVEGARRKARLGLLALTLAVGGATAGYAARELTEQPQPLKVPAAELVKDTCRYEGKRITTQGYLGESAGILAEQKSFLGRIPYSRDFHASHTLYVTQNADRGILVSNPDEELTTPASLSKDSSITYIPPLNPDGQKKEPTTLTGKVIHLPKLGTCYVRVQK